MKKLALVFLIALFSTELVAAKVFYYADEVDYRNNVGYALHRPFDGVDPDVVGDFDAYSCISLNDYNGFASGSAYDAYAPLTAKTATRDDLARLRRDDQLRIVDENPYDNLDRNDIEDYDGWNCYTLRDHNSIARENPYDKREVVDFTDFDHLDEVKKIGTYRYNNFYAFPDDLAKFNLQRTVGRAPFYEPYGFRRSPYPLYGYGVRRMEDY